MLYNSVLYKNRPVKFIDYVNNKYDIVHNKLYNDALNKYLLHFINSKVSGKFIYRIFELISNYFGTHNIVNDEEIKLDEILDYEQFNNLHNTYINIDDVDKYILNTDYVMDLVNVLSQDASITKIFNELQLLESNKTSYIKYLFINIMYIIDKIKKSISNIDGLSDIVNISNISDFTFIYNNVTYIITEDNELISTEDLVDPNIIFITEQIYKEDIHIGYNEDGKWIIDLSDQINIDDDNIYDILYGLITKTNYNIWQVLINNIKEMYLKTHRIIEVKNFEYWQPSSILIITVVRPITKRKVDLTPWWNTYQEYKDLQIDKLMATIDENLVDAKITYIDYVKGKSKVYSKHFDKEATVDLNYVHVNSEVNDESTLSNTFTYKLKHINEY